jgi:hypothetical protein
MHICPFLKVLFDSVMMVLQVGWNTQLYDSEWIVVADRRSVYWSIMKRVTVTVCSLKPMLYILTICNQLCFYIILLQGSCLDTSAPSFARSAQERMLSFSERKARLIENARQRYIEKHGLKSVGFSSWWLIRATGMMGLYYWHLSSRPFPLPARPGPHKLITKMMVYVTCMKFIVRWGSSSGYWCEISKSHDVLYSTENVCPCYWTFFCM